MKKQDNDIFEAIDKGQDLDKYPEDLVSLVVDFKKDLKKVSDPDQIFVNQVMSRIRQEPQRKFPSFFEIFSWTPQIAGVLASLALFSFQQNFSDTSTGPTTYSSNVYFNDSIEKDPLFKKSSPDYSVLLHLELEE